jgi:hypothetical protein
MKLGAPMSSDSRLGLGPPIRISDSDFRLGPPIRIRTPTSESNLLRLTAELHGVPDPRRPLARLHEKVGDVGAGDRAGHSLEA